MDLQEVKKPVKSNLRLIRKLAQDENGLDNFPDNDDNNGDVTDFLGIMNLQINDLVELLEKEQTANDSENSGIIVKKSALRDPNFCDLLEITQERPGMPQAFLEIIQEQSGMPQASEELLEDIVLVISKDTNFSKEHEQASLEKAIEFQEDATSEGVNQFQEKSMTEKIVKFQEKTVINNGVCFQEKNASDTECDNKADAEIDKQFLESSSLETVSDTMNHILKDIEISDRDVFENAFTFFKNATNNNENSISLSKDITNIEQDNKTLSETGNSSGNFVGLNLSALSQESQLAVSQILDSFSNIFLIGQPDPPNSGKRLEDLTEARGLKDEENTGSQTEDDITVDGEGDLDGDRNSAELCHLSYDEHLTCSFYELQLQQNDSSELIEHGQRGRPRQKKVDKPAVPCRIEPASNQPPNQASCMSPQILSSTWQKFQPVHMPAPALQPPLGQVSQRFPVVLQGDPKSPNKLFIQVCPGIVPSHQSSATSTFSSASDANSSSRETKQTVTSSKADVTAKQEATPEMKSPVLASVEIDGPMRSRISKVNRYDPFLRAKEACPGLNSDMGTRVLNAGLVLDGQHGQQRCSAAAAHGYNVAETEMISGSHGALNYVDVSRTISQSQHNSIFQTQHITSFQNQAQINPSFQNQAQNNPSFQSQAQNTSFQNQAQYNLSFQNQTQINPSFQIQAQSNQLFQNQAEHFNNILSSSNRDDSHLKNILCSISRGMCQSPNVCLNETSQAGTMPNINMATSSGILCSERNVPVDVASSFARYAAPGVVTGTAGFPNIPIDRRSKRMAMLLGGGRPVQAAYTNYNHSVTHTPVAMSESSQEEVHSGMIDLSPLAEPIRPGFHCQQDPRNSYQDPAALPSRSVANAPSIEKPNSYARSHTTSASGSVMDISKLHAQPQGVAGHGSVSEAPKMPTKSVRSQSSTSSSRRPAIPVPVEKSKKRVESWLNNNAAFIPDLDSGTYHPSDHSLIHVPSLPQPARQYQESVRVKQTASNSSCEMMGFFEGMPMPMDSQGPDPKQKYNRKNRACNDSTILDRLVEKGHSMFSDASERSESSVSSKKTSISKEKLVEHRQKYFNESAIKQCTHAIGTRASARDLANTETKLDNQTTRQVVLNQLPVFNQCSYQMDEKLEADLAIAEGMKLIEQKSLEKFLAGNYSSGSGGHVLSDFERFEANDGKTSGNTSGTNQGSGFKNETPVSGSIDKSSSFDPSKYITPSDIESLEKKKMQNGKNSFDGYLEHKKYTSEDAKSSQKVSQFSDVKPLEDIPSNVPQTGIGYVSQMGIGYVPQTGICAASQQQFENKHKAVKRRPDDHSNGAQPQARQDMAAGISQDDYILTSFAQSSWQLKQMLEKKGEVFPNQPNTKEGFLQHVVGPPVAQPILPVQSSHQKSYPVQLRTFNGEAPDHNQFSRREQDNLSSNNQTYLQDAERTQPNSNLLDFNGSLLQFDVDMYSSNEISTELEGSLNQLLNRALNRNHSGMMPTSSAYLTHSNDLSPNASEKAASNKNDNQFKRPKDPVCSNIQLETAQQAALSSGQRLIHSPSSNAPPAQKVSPNCQSLAPNQSLSGSHLSVPKVGPNCQSLAGDSDVSMGSDTSLPTYAQDDSMNMDQRDHMQQQELRQLLQHQQYLNQIILEDCAQKRMRQRYPQPMESQLQHQPAENQQYQPMESQLQLQQVQNQQYQPMESQSQHQPALNQQYLPIESQPQHQLAQNQQYQPLESQLQQQEMQNPQTVQTQNEKQFEKVKQQNTQMPSQHQPQPMQHQVKMQRNQEMQQQNFQIQNQHQLRTMQQQQQKLIMQRHQEMQQQNPQQAHSQQLSQQQHYKQLAQPIQQQPKPLENKQQHIQQQLEQTQNQQKHQQIETQHQNQTTQHKKHIKISGQQLLQFLLFQQQMQKQQEHQKMGNQQSPQNIKINQQLLIKLQQLQSNEQKHFENLPSQNNHENNNYGQAQEPQGIQQSRHVQQQDERSLGICTNVTNPQGNFGVQAVPSHFTTNVQTGNLHFNGRATEGQPGIISFPGATTQKEETATSANRTFIRQDPESRSSVSMQNSLACSNQLITSQSSLQSFGTVHNVSKGKIQAQNAPHSFLHKPANGPEQLLNGRNFIQPLQPDSTKTAGGDAEFRSSTETQLRKYLNGEFPSLDFHQESFPCFISDTTHSISDTTHSDQSKKLVDSAKLSHERKDGNGDSKVQPAESSREQTDSDISVLSVSSDVDMLSFQPDNDGETPLHLLCDMPKELRDKMFSFSSMPGFSKAINLQNRNQETALQIAIQNEDLEIVSFLVSQGADVNIICLSSQKGRRGKTSQPFSRSEIVQQTALHEAVEVGNLDIIKVLLASKNINVDAKRPDSGFTPLMLAFQIHQRSDRREIILELMNHQASLGLHDNQQGKTPLMFAIQSRDVALVEDILQQVGAERARALVTDRTKMDMTCLHFAADRNLESALKKRLLRCIIVAGGDASAKNSEGETPRDWDKENITDVLQKLAGMCSP